MSIRSSFFLNLLCLFVFLPLTSWAQNFNWEIQDQNLFSRYRAPNIAIASKTNPNNLVGLDSYCWDQRYYIQTHLKYEDFTDILVRLKPKFTLTDHSENLWVYFDESYASFHPFNHLDIDIGRKKANWGTGYAWNLVSLFENKNRFIDTDIEYNELFQAQYFWGQDLTTSFLHGYNDKKTGIKLHTSSTNLDLDIYGFLEEGRGKIGGDLSFVANQNLELHAEVLIQNGSDSYYPTNPTSDIYLWEQTKKEGSYFVPFIIGLQYTTDDLANIIFEYFYNPAGLNKDENTIFKNGVDASLLNQKYTQNTVWRQFLFDTHTYYQFSRFQQHYLFFRFFKERVFPSIDFEWIEMYSPVDSGHLIVPSISYKVSEESILKTSLFVPFGNEYSEFKWYYNNFLEFSYSVYL